MDIVIFGAGSLGSLVGGLLATNHDVTLVGREDHMETVRRNGLQVVGELELTVHPGATTTGTGLDTDLVIVTVKAYDTVPVAADLETGRFDTVLSLQNGMGNEETLAGALDESVQVLSGTTTYGALLRSPGVVQCSGIGEVVIGPFEGGESPAAEKVAGAFNSAGLDCVIDTNMPRQLWEKLAVNAAINPITALARCRNGALSADPANAIAREAAREVASVARSREVELSDAEAVAALEKTIAQTSANTSSMAFDVANDRRTEIDAINGYVVDHATESADVPINTTLLSLVRTWEQGHEIAISLDE